MPWSAGVYNRLNGATGWVDDSNAFIGIEATRHDTQDNDFRDGINNCLAKDGTNAATQNLNLGGQRFTNAGTATARTDLISVAQVQDSSVVYGATSGGSANAQTLTLSPAITAYAAGQRFTFLAGYTNTAAATLNVNSVGAKNIFNAVIGTAIGAGEIIVGRAYEVLYDGTQFLLLNDVTPIQNGDYIWLGTTAGTATAQTASATPALTAYKVGQKFRMKPGSASTGTNVTSHTLNINSLGAKNIKVQDGAFDPTIGDWIINSVLELVYDGTNFTMTNAPGPWLTYSPTFSVSAGSASGVAYDHAVYQKTNRVVHWQLTVSWTQNTSTAAFVDITFPISPYYNYQTLAVTGQIGGSTVSGFCLPTATTFRFYNYNQNTWGTGPNLLSVGGIYMSA